MRLLPYTREIHGKNSPALCETYFPRAAQLFRGRRATNFGLSLQMKGFGAPPACRGRCSNIFISSARTSLNPTRVSHPPDARCSSSHPPQDRAVIHQLHRAVMESCARIPRRRRARSCLMFELVYPANGFNVSTDSPLCFSSLFFTFFTHFIVFTGLLFPALVVPPFSARQSRASRESSDERRRAREDETRVFR